MIKGAVILDTLRAVRAREGESGYARLMGLLDDGSRRVLGGEILDTGWYPLDAFARFLEADVRETANGSERVLIARAEEVVEKQLRGIYRVFSRSGSAESMIGRMANIHATYFRGVSVQVEMASRQALITYTGFETQHRIMRSVIIGFYRRALRLAGARSVTAAFSLASADTTGWKLVVSWH